MQERVTVREGAAGIVVRSYRSAADYQADAGSMGSAGWTPISQVETTGGMSGGGVALIVLGIICTLIISIVFGIILIVLGAIVGAATRKKTLVVTYKHGGPPAGVAPVAQTT